MKVSLIYPGITGCGFNCNTGNEGTFINHGLCLLSACLKKRGHQVDLIDLRRLLSWEHFEAVVNKDDLGIVGITMMSCDFVPALKCAEIIKKNKPETKIVVGGPHPSIMPEELENESCVDYVHTGEGEISFISLAEDIEKGKKREKVIKSIQPNLDDIPFADRDLFSCAEEPFVPFLHKPFVTIIAGRGCAYNCSYCQPAEKLIFGKGVRRRSVENVISELKNLQDKFNFKSVMIHDDCLTEDTEWVLKFCDSYKKECFRQPFVCQSRPDIICKHEDVVSALRDAGLALFIIGFESGSDRILKFLRKGTTVEQNLRASEICHKYGISIWANYMLGLPTETKEEQIATYNMLKEIRPYHCSPAYYTPHPGSDLFEYGLKHDLHLIKDHYSYRRNRFEPKIKGVDYVFLEKILRKTYSLGKTQKSVKGLLKRYLPASGINILKKIIKQST